MEKQMLHLIELLAFMGFMVILAIVLTICVYFDAKYGSKNTEDEKPKKREIPQTKTFKEAEGGETPYTKNENVGNLPSKISGDFKHSLKRFFDE